MTTFVGDYPCKIDAKGRVLFPAAFKKQLATNANGRFVVKKDIFEKCLVLYSSDEWERQIKIIRSKINPYKKEHARFLREFYKGTAELSLDSNNRLLFPKRLLELVGVSKDIIMAGQDDRIEIWDKGIYESQDMGESDFAGLAEKLLGDDLINEI